ncbi:putative carboxypeptidase D [Zostera marina]|uniref:Putative carboxypeptidase D n=1 Tax=Zostera marina TaxID=29655 RepID=A0A0K9NHS8_ZOSMR|nr:putative carboxypeptidase D [Zostera marina]
MDWNLLRRLFLIGALIFSTSFPPSPALARGGDRPSNRTEWRDGLVFGRQLFEEENPSRITDDQIRGYMTNSELEGFVKDFGQRCRNISTIYSIGRSVRGIPLWVIEISDKPGEEEPEPSFKFIANMHGDEPVGRELLVRLANWLCDNYLKDPLATTIVENVHLHILPTMNPDGFSLRTRENANNVDLNRDFPDQFFPVNDIVDTRQPETKAIITWMKEKYFTASASLHGGALVVNYPWDGSKDTRKHYYECPDDKTFRYLAQIYSHSHHNMSLSSEFRDGITNGADWYPIYGGMQDWNYIHEGCFEWTVEISDLKWPKATELPKLWEYNRLSMLNIVASILKTRVHGRIFSSSTGHPLPASVLIKGNPIKINATTKLGSYHRLLVPGESYQITAAMSGFQSKTTEIHLRGNKGASLDFILDPLEEEAPLMNNLKNCDCDYAIGLHIFLVFCVFFLFMFYFFRKKLPFKSFIRPIKTSIV